MCGRDGEDSGVKCALDCVFVLWNDSFFIYNFYFNFYLFLMHFNFHFLPSSTFLPSYFRLSLFSLSTNHQRTRWPTRLTAASSKSERPQTHVCTTQLSSTYPITSTPLRSIALTLRRGHRLTRHFGWCVRISRRVPH